MIDGRYCQHHNQTRKEKRDNFLKAAGGTVVAVGSLVLTVVLKRGKV